MTPSARSRQRLSQWSRREFGYRPFLVLLGLGLFVRVATMVMYYPAILQTPDSIRFARIFPTSIFGDPWMPAGYALFARGLRALTPELWATTAIQHLLGLATGVILYLAVRRLGGKRWLACIPAGVVFLSGDQIWIEHQVMAETLMIPTLAAGLTCAIYGLVPRVDIRWLVASSVLLMLAGLCRNVALVALPMVVLATAIYARGSYATCLRALAAAALPALVVFGFYLTAFEVSGGQYLGFTDMSGWDLYTRAGPFADCSKFTPPPGTEDLCESTPPDQRDGPYGFVWDPEAAAPKHFEVSAATSPIVGGFARRAILDQPLDYLSEVALDLVRYVDPSVHDEKPWSGFNNIEQSNGLFNVYNPATAEFVDAEMSRGYDGARERVIDRDLVATYENLFSLGGLMILVLLALSVIGAFLSRGALRLGILLFGATALLLYVVPVLTIAYELRYGLPPQLLLAVSGALGLAAVVQRRFPGTALTQAP